MIDLTPAADRLIAVLDAIGDDRLTAPTPCTGATVGDLVDHVGSFSAAFTAAAERDFSMSGPGTADASRLRPDWRTAIPQSVASLARAWTDPAAWQGMTRAGGNDLPADLTGRIALDEIVLHGWDLARACDLPWDPAPAELEVCLALIPAMSPPENRQVGDALFGPAVDVPSDAPLLDRVLGLSGRDPGWSPPR